jgi:hypothetical protein
MRDPRGHLRRRTVIDDFVVCLRLQRREVRGRGQHVFRTEVGNDRGHERSPRPVPVATLHVVELRYTRRASRKLWYRTETA